MTQKNATQSIDLADKKIFQTKSSPTSASSIKKIEEAIDGSFKDVANPLWFSVSETAKLGGVRTKTIRRAIQSNAVKYKVIGNRYSVDFASVIIYLHSKKKLKNKFDNFGIGQYLKPVKPKKP